VEHECDGTEEQEGNIRARQADDMPTHGQRGNQ
jgi:hypothetical protein